MNKGLINKKLENFGEWYREIIIKGELIQYYDVKGCYVLLPNSYSVWENIKIFLDREFKVRGVENYYFPLFVTKENLQKEQNHLEGFKAEVAWIKDDNKDSIIAVRPTSECIICPVMSKLIRSYQDLPKKVNQWANVVRNEFKETMPFIRSREFLWQEGHTFYENKKDAQDEVFDIINVYKKTYENLLGVPVILGKKTKMETFAGAEYTYTVEGYIPEANKGIQCATSHFLGQTFTKMFDIKYSDAKMDMNYCFYNSWGFTTRSIGVMIQTHGDNKGLIFPPKIAPIHIVIIPIYTNNKEKVCQFSDKLKKQLEDKYIVKIDNTENRPGYKYNYWELRGVPLRIEIGEKEIDNGVYTIVRRDTGEKLKITNLGEIDNILNNIQENLYNRALQKLQKHIKYSINIEEVGDIIKDNLVLVEFCGEEECEELMKTKYNIKSLCMPEDNKINNIENRQYKCILCQKKADNLCLFGKSY